MKNDTYIFEGLQTIELVSTGFNQAITLCKSNGINNIKLVVQDFNYDYEFVAKYMNSITGDSVEEITKRLNKKGYRIEKDSIGINVLSIANFSNHVLSSTVWLFLSVFSSSFKRVKKDVIGSNFDIILCVPDGSYNDEFKALVSDLNIVSYTKI